MDPISLKDTHTRDYCLVLQEQKLDIFFESQENLDTYIGMPIEYPGLDLMHNLDNPSDELGGDWN